MNSPLVFAETIIFKSGKRIEGKIIEKTDEYVKLDVEGISLTFWLTEIERIDEKVSFPSQVAVSESLSSKSEIEKIINETEKYFLNEKYEDALLSTKKAIELDPTNYEFYLALGIIYYYLGNFQESIHSFQKALTLNPKDPDCYLFLGIVYDSIGLQKEAKEALIKSIEQHKEEKDWSGIFITEGFLKKIIK